MIDAIALNQNLIKREKESGVKFDTRTRKIIVNTLIEYYNQIKEEEINKQAISDIFRGFIRTNHLSAKWELYLKENNIDLRKTKEVKRKNNSVKRSYLEEVFPICISKDGYTINLAGMKKLSPTGDNWGYAPLKKAYKTQKEAEEVRKELWKTISSWVNNNK